ncbi:MAG: hypothetical protein ABIJ24_03755 [Nitrospinota bacterium]|nr:hypothetical protein [Nitrospinota bacterium]
MAEITKFQEMNGCAGCKQADENFPQGKSAEDYGEGANFWCNVFKKGVATKYGCSCPSWESN